MKQKKTIRLYLDDAQIATVRDALGVDCHILEIPANKPGLIKYGVPRSGARPKAPRLYLTSWQQRLLRDEMGGRRAGGHQPGHSLDSIELEKGQVIAYSVPPDDGPKPC
jgi:hypothetical protein